MIEKKDLSVHVGSGLDDLLLDNKVMSLSRSKPLYGLFFPYNEQGEIRLWSTSDKN